MHEGGRTSVLVRSAGTDDAVALARLSLHFAGTTDPDPAEIADLAEELRIWMRTDGARHRVAIAVRGEEAVGMAWLALIARPPREAGQRRLSGDLQSVFVESELRGGGIGGRLVQHLLAMLDGRTTVHSSPAAVPFYTRLGFAASPLLLQRPSE